MNKILILFSCFLVSCFGFAQAPQSFKYQAVARNSDGTMMINSNMVVRVSIRDSSLVGNVVYQESHNVTTNALGIINLSIGKGFVLQGVFVNIPWGSGEKFIEIEMDMGAGYLSISNSQLLSVPYALYAANSPPGPQGAPGISLNWLGNLNVAPSSPNLNDAYYNIVLKKSFVWNGSSWSIIAQDGNDGSQGIQGQQGPIGNQGPVGVSLNWLGNLNVAPTLPNLNDAYYNTVLKKSFVWNGTSWTIIAQDGNDGQQGMQGQQGLQGPIGNQGPVGVSLNWLGNLNAAPISPNLNDAYYNTVLKKSFVWNGSSWTIIAQDGNDGPQGSSFLSNIQYINNSLFDVYDTTDVVCFNVASWVVLPSANNVVKGKMIAFVKPTLGNGVGYCYIAARGNDNIIGGIQYTTGTSLVLGSSSFTNSLILVSDGVSKWYVISY